MPFRKDLPNPSYDQELLGKLSTTVFAVEANTFEQHMLWRMYAEGADAFKIGEHQRVKWEQDLGGNGWIIGHMGKDKLPVMLSLLWAVLDGQRVLFYHVTSQVANYRYVDQWLKLVCPQLFPENTSDLKTDAGNFHNCVAFIKANSKTA